MIKLICVGKVKDEHLLALINDYQRKISRYHKLEIIEVKDEPIRDNEKQVLDMEADRLLNVIDRNDYVILLDLHGKSIDSIWLALKNNVSIWVSATVKVGLSSNPRPKWMPPPSFSSRSIESPIFAVIE